MNNKVDKETQTNSKKKYITPQEKKEAMKVMTLQHYRNKVLQNENRIVEDGKKGRKKFIMTEEEKKQKHREYQKKYILKKKQQQNIIIEN